MRNNSRNRHFYPPNGRALCYQVGPFTLDNPPNPPFSLWSSGLHLYTLMTQQLIILFWFLPNLVRSLLEPVLWVFQLRAALVLSVLAHTSLWARESSASTELGNLGFSSTWVSLLGFVAVSESHCLVLISGLWPLVNESTDSTVSARVSGFVFLGSFLAHVDFICIKRDDFLLVSDDVFKIEGASGLVWGWSKIML